MNEHYEQLMPYNAKKAYLRRVKQKRLKLESMLNANTDFEHKFGEVFCAGTLKQ